jgi:hypothetical protein
MVERKYECVLFGKRPTTAIAYVSLLLTASPSIQDLKTLLMKSRKKKEGQEVSIPELIDGSVS